MKTEKRNSREMLMSRCLRAKGASKEISNKSLIAVYEEGRPLPSSHIDRSHTLTPKEVVSLWSSPAVSIAAKGCTEAETHKVSYERSRTRIQSGAAEGCQEKDDRRE